MSRCVAPETPDVVLDGVRALGDEAAALGRGVAPMLVRQAEKLHAAYATAVGRPELFARGNANRSKDHELAERSIRAELAVALGVSERVASRMVDRAGLLMLDLPRTRAALQDARILWEAGTAICDVAATLPAASRAEFDERAVELAESVTPTQLNRRLKPLRELLHEVPFFERHQRAREDRAVWVSSEADGMCLVNLLLPAVEGMAIYDRADRTARSLRKIEGEERTLAQLRADSIADLQINGDIPLGNDGARIRGFDGLSTAPGAGAGADTGPGAREDTGAGAGVHFGGGTGAGTITGTGTGTGSGSDSDSDSDSSIGDETSVAAPRPAYVAGIRAEVRITVPVLTAAGIDDTPAELDGYGPIPAEIARELVGTASHYYRVLTDPVTDQVLSVGRAMRMPPENMRRFLQLRDGTCRFPGCTRPATRAELDHGEEWQNGGETSVENLTHLCTAHHVRHGERWRYRKRADGTVIWITPTGRQIITKPATVPTSRKWPTFVDTEADPGDGYGTGMAVGAVPGEVLPF